MDTNKLPEGKVTVQVTKRYDRRLFKTFEADCNDLLASPKRVIEALILHWLSINAEERIALARQYETHMIVCAKMRE